MLRVLQVVYALDGGGIEKILYNYYSNMDKDKIKMELDFIMKLAT
ncbi:hypothetical protein [Marinilactibacillus psychrotolerans]